MTELDQLREEILQIDEDILRLVQRRLQAATRVGHIKRAAGLPLQNFTVEKNVLDHSMALADDLGLDRAAVQQLVRALIRSSVKAQERERIRREPTGRNALVVGGAGLMGQWFARFLTEQGFTVHVDDPRPSPFPVGDPARTRYDLVVLATPPSSIPETLDRLLPALPAPTLVIDIASIKGPAKDRLLAAARDGHHVASLHPMFGPGTDLLMGQNVLVLDCGDADATQRAAEVFNDTAATTHRLNLDEHDGLMADVLGLAHAVSIVFNQTLAGGDRSYDELARFASTTFRKQADVSREVAHENPRLYFEIQTLNPAMDRVLARFQTALETFRQVVASRDEAAFERLMKETREWYDRGAPA